jgi:hypothetical protein
VLQLVVVVVLVLRWTYTGHRNNTGSHGLSVLLLTEVYFDYMFSLVERS